MLAVLSRDLPEEDHWVYEFKYDGFRCIVFWDGNEMLMQSRDLKPLNRYFPELEASLREALPSGCVVDGEIVIPTPKGFDFEALLLRIHPAASRVQKLSRETPASFVAFDLLASEGESLLEVPFRERHKRLLKLLKKSKAPVHVTPSTTDRSTARMWFKKYEGAGVDGVMAKDPESLYVPGERVMIKVKHQRTADCVVGGFRWAKNREGEAIGSLLIGLYKGSILHYTGHCSNFKLPERKELVKFLAPYRKNIKDGFGKGRAPGGPSRWAQADEKRWEPVRPELVCEVAYDHMQGARFRHGTSFLRWRFDKSPGECTYDQLREAKAMDPAAIFKIGQD